MARESDAVKDFYDRSYKKLFSHKGFVKYLLQGFVRLKWVELVDFDKITLEPVSFIGRLFEKKEADIKGTVLGIGLRCSLNAPPKPV